MPLTIHTEVTENKDKPGTFDLIYRAKDHLGAQHFVFQQGTRLPKMTCMLIAKANDEVGVSATNEILMKYRNAIAEGTVGPEFQNELRAILNL